MLSWNQSKKTFLKNLCRQMHIKWYISFWRKNLYSHKSPLKKSTPGMLNVDLDSDNALVVYFILFDIKSLYCYEILWVAWLDCETSEFYSCMAMTFPQGHGESVVWLSLKTFIIYCLYISMDLYSLTFSLIPMLSLLLNRTLHYCYLH